MAHHIKSKWCPFRNNVRIVSVRIRYRDSRCKQFQFVYVIEIVIVNSISMCGCSVKMQPNDCVYTFNMLSGNVLNVTLFKSFIFVILFLGSGAGTLSPDSRRQPSLAPQAGTNIYLNLTSFKFREMA